jgi:hypothetical protein
VEVKSSYLICYLGGGNQLVLHSRIDADGMGGAMKYAEDVQKREPGIGRMFVMHAYEVPYKEPQDDPS